MLFDFTLRSYLCLSKDGDNKQKLRKSPLFHFLSPFLRSTKIRRTQRTSSRTVHDYSHVHGQLIAV